MLPGAIGNELDERARYFVGLSANAATRVVSSPVDGMPQAMDGIYPVMGDLSARFSVESARILEGGYDVETGTRWGRYADGFVAVLDRIDGSVIDALNVTAQSAHFVMSAVNAGPVTLPVSGTASYALMGNTSPTDNFGNVGVLGNATLAVDFGNQRVASSLNLSIAGSQWVASTPALDGTAAGGVPIQKGMYFEAAKALNGAGNLAVTVNGNPAFTAGALRGGFFGQTGQAAAVGYALHNAVEVPTTVSGVAVFKR